MEFYIWRTIALVLISAVSGNQFGYPALNFGGVGCVGDFCDIGAWNNSHSCRVALFGLDVGFCGMNEHYAVRC
ncbi:hypothetical protein PC116_g29918 [Phytophthora cactorum]|uniref:Uncharacterized protein n=1 Tax=Phytophthora cactorum TaxID=29920 RepID=A0A8T1JBX8_9STRA|nr:hypothetical protein PC111_g24369 [Phytophthora cactorum]KAG2788621.1 hypothetical protein PC112_g24488 [Phytophthora cactorum]KAG2804285.1 hypothetical protein PC113_g24329 [Phytophthora cactorum]KAG2870506.1 hypothetical protein PC114_g27353 [Phytophthora cactorum]KAG2872979.1 hypothetical protein PC115_g24481 [Phytophthora cactorum]